MLHALWNTSATVLGGGGFLLVYGFVMVPLFVALIVIVVWQRRREQRTVIAQLPGFARAGWIAPSEVPLLSSLAGRRGWRAAVRRRSGKQVAKAVADYQSAITDLAFLRSRMARGAVGDSGQLWHDQALDARHQGQGQGGRPPGGAHGGHPAARTAGLDAAPARTAARRPLPGPRPVPRLRAGRPAPELAAPPHPVGEAPGPVKPVTGPRRSPRAGSNLC